MTQFCYPYTQTEFLEGKLVELKKNLWKLPNFENPDQKKKLTLVFRIIFQSPEQNSQK